MTRWPEAIPLRGISAETVARSFVTYWISTFGLPTTVTTDRGTQFRSVLFHSLTSLLGIKCIHTTAYYPCANGMVERFHRQLKSCVKAAPDSTRRFESLPLILLALRTLVNEDLSCTPSQLIFGCNLRLPGDFCTSSTENSTLDPAIYADSLQSAKRQLRQVPPHPQSSKSHCSSALSTCKFVFVRNDTVKKPLQSPYDGPFKVLRRHEKQFSFEVNAKPNTISLDQIKAAHIDSPTAAS